MTNDYLQLIQKYCHNEPIIYFTATTFKREVERIVDERLKILIEEKELKDER